MSDAEKKEWTGGDGCPLVEAAKKRRFMVKVESAIRWFDAQDRAAKKSRVPPREG